MDGMHGWNEHVLHSQMIVVASISCVVVVVVVTWVLMSAPRCFFS